MTEEERERLLRLARANVGNLWVTYPYDGLCGHCGHDLVEGQGKEAIEAGKPVTGCMNCNVSYCE
jgi:hypothetical protein